MQMEKHRINHIEQKKAEPKSGEPSNYMHMTIIGKETRICKYEYGNSQTDIYKIRY